MTTYRYRWILVFALGLAVGWSLRAGRSTPHDVWDDAHWWAKGFDDGLAFHGEPHPAKPYSPCGPNELGLRDDVFESGHDGRAGWWIVRTYCSERPPNWEPFPCGGESGPCTP
jgi:hypothetical protein